jgi:hypothetical protein
MDVSTSTSATADRLRWVALGAVGAGLAAFVVPVPLRSALVAVAVLLGPGAAVVRLAALPSRLAAVVVAGACALALTQTVSLVLLYAQAWSWQTTLLVVLGVTALLAVLPRPGTTPDEPVAEQGHP